MYELGIAHALAKPTVPISQELYKKRKLPFDITHMATVPYQLPTTTKDRNARQLAIALTPYLSLRRTHDNPVSIAVNAGRLFLANLFGHQFLSGFLRTLHESRRAKVAWIVSTKLFWERLDSTFHRRILEERILTGKRKELVLLPETEANQRRKTGLLQKYRRSNPNITEFMRILLVRDTQMFSFLATEISIYDRYTPDLRAILLEPMATEGADRENDSRIAEALRFCSTRDLRVSGLKEKTFDILLPNDTAERLAMEFQARWNEECLRRKLKRWCI